MLKKYRFLFFILIVIILSLFLSGLGLYAYHQSGAYVVDLSRPSYTHIRQDIKKDEDRHLNQNGKIDSKFIKNFDQSFKYYQRQIKADDNFSADALSDQALGLEE